MAGDWIPACKGLANKPEVSVISKMSGLHRCHVVGALIGFWDWADDHTADGFIAGIDLDSLEDIHRQTRPFWQAMIQVGWLQVDAKGVTIPHFHYWHGKSAKQRLLKNRRQHQWREGVAPDVDAHVDGSASTSAPTREEKRREEKSKKDPPTPQIAGEGGGKDEFPKTEKEPEPEQPEPERIPEPPEPPPPEPVALPPADHDLTPAGLAQQFAFVAARPRYTSEKNPAELTSTFADLIACGVDPAEILRHILDPARPKRQTHWQFAERWPAKRAGPPKAVIDASLEQFRQAAERGRKRWEAEQRSRNGPRNTAQSSP